MTEWHPDTMGWSGPPEEFHLPFTEDERNTTILDGGESDSSLSDTDDTCYTWGTLHSEQGYSDIDPLITLSSSTLLPSDFQTVLFWQTNIDCQFVRHFLFDVTKEVGTFSEMLSVARNKGLIDRLQDRVLTAYVNKVERGIQIQNVETTSFTAASLDQLDFDKLHTNGQNVSD
jgi:hypothetical protein